MEPFTPKIDEPFGRQPEPVLVTITGHPVDVQYWYGFLKRQAEFKGDMTNDTYGSDCGHAKCFKIYPRAVNE